MTVPASAPLCIVPAHLRTTDDVDALMRCLVSLSVTAPQAGVIVIDDGSPDAALREAAQLMCAELDFTYYLLNAFDGFAAAANVGLNRAALARRDAVVLRQDVELIQSGWLDAMLSRTDSQGRPAAVVGARILSPNRRLRNAGWQFSQLARRWTPRFEHGPADLPAALIPTLCPVSSDLMLIRERVLAAVGPFDAALAAGAADIDFAIRVFEAGEQCVYDPAITAVRTGPADADRSKRLADWATRSQARLAAKWATYDLSPFVPEAL